MVRLSCETNVPKLNQIMMNGGVGFVEGCVEMHSIVERFNLRVKLYLRTTHFLQNVPRAKNWVFCCIFLLLFPSSY